MAGHTESQFGLARLLADLLDPPELDEARTWYTRAAEDGHTEAQYDLGMLLAERIDPPELDEARGRQHLGRPGRHAGARFKLGLMPAAQLAKPELAEAHSKPEPVQRERPRRRAGAQMSAAMAAPVPVAPRRAGRRPLTPTRPGWSPASSTGRAARPPRPRTASSPGCRRR